MNKTNIKATHNYNNAKKPGIILDLEYYGKTNNVNETSSNKNSLLHFAQCQISKIPYIKKS